LAIEIRSPGDETLEKLDFYSRVGLAELLVVDSDDKSVRRWTLDRATLVERPPDSDGWHRLDSLDVRLATRDERIILVASTGTTTVI
jgi:Uma2 family endonuclease